MKKISLLIIAFAMVHSSFAQWTTSGTSIYNTNTGNVGIGTTNPYFKFEVSEGNNATSNIIAKFGTTDPNWQGLYIQNLTNVGSVIQSTYTNVRNNILSLNPNGGNVGIATTNPIAKLHIANAYDLNTTSSLKLFYQGTWGTVNYASNFRFIDISSTEGGDILEANGYGIGIGYNPPVYNSSDKLYINGNVGIGTTTPDAKLAVNGTIHTKEVKVDLLNWSDYVFKPSYNLPSLAFLKTYIEANHHLPEMPSENDVVKDGINLGEMNKLLTKKVEELTLYLIEKDKQLKQQQIVNREQQKINEQLMARMLALEKASKGNNK